MSSSLRAAILVSALAGMGWFQTLHAQTIVVGLPSPQITLYAPAGGVSSPQNIPISLSSGAASFTITTSTQTGIGWLQATPAFGQLSTTPANLTVNATAISLAPGTYTGFISVNVAGLTSSIITVTFVVGLSGTTSIYTTPTAMNFAAQVDSTSPAPQALTVYSSSSSMGFTAGVSSTGNWLALTTGGGITPSILTVQVSSAGLPVGTYTGTITLTPQQGPALNVPVTLTVGNGVALNVSPKSLQFYYQIGQFTPPLQVLTFSSSSGTPLNFSVSASDTWISVTPSGGNTTQDIIVTVNPTGMTPGTYTSSIIAASTNAATPLQSIPVTLVVSTGNLLTLGSPIAPFNFQVGGATPFPQTITVGTTWTPVNFAVSTTVSGGGNWLSIRSDSTTTPATLTVSANPSGLAAGTYTGLVTVSSSGVVNSPQTFLVTLNVTTLPTLNATPSGLVFGYQPGSPNQVLSQVVSVTATGNPQVSVTTSTSSCGSNWLQVSAAQFQAPAQLTVTIEPAGLPSPQLCQGTIALIADGLATPVILPVLLNVSNAGLLNISPGALSFTAKYGGASPAAQQLSLTTTDGSLIQYTLFPTVSWLSLNAGTGYAPIGISVSVNPAGLNPGTYTGGILVTSPGLPSQETIPVILTVNGASNVSLSPTTLSFTQPAGGAPVSKSLSITSTGSALTFTANAIVVQSATNWLSVSPKSGTTPATLTVSVNPGALPAGNYNGEIDISIPGAATGTITVPVSLSLTGATSIAASTTSVDFSYQTGATIPAAKTVSLTGTGGSVPFTTAVNTTNGGSWLTATSTATSTPATLTISVNPAGLGPGAYSGQVSIAAPGSTGSPISIAVSLEVLLGNVPNPSSVVNAASSADGPIAPGEIVSIKGGNFGTPPAGILWQSNFVKVDTTLGGTQVFFDGVAAPILYTSASQINAIVPFELAGGSTTQMTVAYQGTTSAPMTLQVLPAVPGIFTTSSTGSGQGSILNQDNTLNSPGNRATPGSVIQIFGTAGGQTNPLSGTGGITAPIQAWSVYSVTATLGGQPATVTYSGAAPNSVVGLFQVNVQVPDNASSDPAAKVVITVNGKDSQTTATVAIQ